jgi:hypothetical protein
MGGYPKGMGVGAVPLSEAWNEASAPMVASTIAPAVTAKHTTVEKAAEPDREQHDREQHHLALLALIKENHSIYDEIIALRADETRRSTLYMVFGAVLFGILFLYIDRLQGHVRTLNKLLIPPHTSRATEYLQSPRSIQIGSGRAWYS